MNRPAALLDRNETSLVLEAFGAGEKPELVIGAPHHAPAGVRRLKCGRAADQNTGLLAWHTAELIRVPVAIVTNASSDPNKSLDSDYARAIRSLKPGVLLEIHGHGGRKARYDIEVSCGSAARSPRAADFAEALRSALAADPDLKDLSVCGDFDRIHYRATLTRTMTTNEWLGIHVELPLSVRKHRGSIELPAAGERLASHLAAVALRTTAPPAG